MPEEITCFACEQAPTQQCPRCGRPYCDDHGEDVCDACLEPASGLPSFTLYRGSLLVLLIATALAVWLILQPPGDSGTAAVSPPVATATELVIQIPTATTAPGTEATQPPSADQTPATQQTPQPQETPGTTATTSPENTPAAGGTTTYTVQAGDSLFDICSNLSSLDPTDCVDQVLEINAISDPGAIAVGETLTIPLQ